MDLRLGGRIAVAVALVFAAVLTAAPGATARPDVVADGYGPPNLPNPTAWAWTQLVPGGAQIRYVTPGTDCPFLEFTVGGQPVRRSMVRSSVVGAYPSTATVCSRMVEAGATAARVDPQTTQGIRIRPTANGTVPLPDWSLPGATKPRPENIALLGDSGCRIPQSGPMQRCTASGWPFRQVSGNAARRPVRPDLAIHVGDYLYRSSPSRQPRPLCGAQGLGNNAHTWGCLVTDFFEPAEELLAETPFVFVRGNHENCGRAGAVWFRYLATTPSATACDAPNPEDYTPPARINAGTLGLLLMDTSCAADEENPPSCDHAGLVGRYTAQFNEINNSLVRDGDNFLLSHSPLWTVNGRTPNDNPEWIDQNLDTALAASTLGRLDRRVTFVLSGHVHLYQMLAVDSAPATRRPPQLTVGSSGTTLDPQTWVDAQLIGKPVDNLPIAQLVTRREWGYAVLRDLTTTWNVRFFDRTGDRVNGTDCDLVGTTFPACR
ncbi:metallophosphoesterase [Asanoa sp. WMMD1127]|uniref:metallophosphoesterase n=1 Tax=Asanoa sp. WMMD1127 TaxID=3016107 RepID=UPI0024178A30|nr:metallophosphoesterase [Asanoa sp. WMMD1127]MDG4821066.1 metallophosphoesterase [Asanoa sp. WMMD1127]